VAAWHDVGNPDKAAAVVAVGLAVIAAIVFLTGGVVADSTGPDSLTFFDISVHATSAQVFLTGALCTWMLFAAVWLLTSGMRRSRLRSAELAEARRMRRAQRRNAPGNADRFAEPEGWADDEADADRFAAGQTLVGGIPLGSAFVEPGTTGTAGQRPLDWSGFGDGDDPAAGQQPAEEPSGGH
jgi:hypothetical protein